MHAYDIFFCRFNQTTNPHKSNSALQGSLINLCKGQLAPLVINTIPEIRLERTANFKSETYFAIANQNWHLWQSTKESLRMFIYRDDVKKQIVTRRKYRARLISFGVFANA